MDDIERMTEAHKLFRSLETVGADPLWDANERKDIARIKAVLDEKDSQIASLKEALKGHMIENHEYIEKLTKEIASLTDARDELKELNVKAWEDKIRLEREITSLKLRLAEAEMKNKNLLEIEASLKELLKEWQKSTWKDHIGGSDLLNRTKEALCK